MVRPLLDVEQAAALLNVSPLTLRAWAQRGRVPCVRLGRKTLRFDPADLQAWVQEHSEAAVAGGVR